VSQPQVAAILNVSPSIGNDVEAQSKYLYPKFAKAIINFMGYFPFQSTSLGEQLYYTRLITGKTQKEVADLIGCDESNLRWIERDQRKPQLKIMQRIQDFINSARLDLSTSQ
jgi:hypothetical protein